MCILNKDCEGQRYFTRAGIVKSVTILNLVTSVM